MGFLAFIANFNWIGLILAVIGLLAILYFKKDRDNNADKPNKKFLYAGIGLLVFGILFLFAKLPLQLAGIV